MEVVVWLLVWMLQTVDLLPRQVAVGGDRLPGLVATDCGSKVYFQIWSGPCPFVYVGSIIELTCWVDLQDTHFYKGLNV